MSLLAFIFPLPLGEVAEVWQEVSSKRFFFKDTLRVSSLGWQSAKSLRLFWAIEVGQQ